MNEIGQTRATDDVRLILVRHAAHGDLGRRLSGRGPAAPLTAEGARQAGAVARRLAEERITAVQTSPRERARATAEAIAAAGGVRAAVVEALDEIDFGAWTGAEFEALEGTPDWEAWNVRRGSARAPGGESMGEATARIAGHAAAVVRERPGETVVLVTHCDMIRGFVAHCLGLTLDNLLRFEIGPASVTRIEAGPGWERVVSLNEGRSPNGDGAA